MTTALNFIVVGGSNGSTNLGDEGMWEAVVDYLRRLLGDVRIAADSVPGWQPTRDGVVALPMLHPEFKRWRGRPSSRAQAALMLAANSSLQARARNMADRFVHGDMKGDVARHWYRAIDECDGLIISGAGGMTDEFALHGVFGWSAIARRAALQGKRVAVIGQGVGPLKSKRVTEEAKRLLTAASLVTVRDSLSLKVVESELGLRHAVATPDWALALEVSDEDRAVAADLRDALVGHRSFIAVSFHDRRTANRADLVELQWLCAQLVTEAQERGQRVLGIANCTNSGRSDDRLFMAELFSRLPEEMKSQAHLLTTPVRPAVARALFGMAEYVVATRYHPVVFALAEGTPSAGVSFDSYYDQKLSGALEWYGEGHRVINLKDGRFTASALLQELTNDLGRSDRQARSREFLDRVEEPLHDWLHGYWIDSN